MENWGCFRAALLPFVNIDQMRPCPFHAALHVCHAPAEDKIVYSGCECLWRMNTHIQSQ